MNPEILNSIMYHDQFLFIVLKGAITLKNHQCNFCRLKDNFNRYRLSLDGIQYTFIP